MIYPWQHKQWSVIVKQFQQQRLPHALLLTGIDGLGQLDFARALAQLVLCTYPGEQACGQCRQCRLFTNTGHPDFYCVSPDVSSKVIKIDQMRQLIDQVAKTPQLARSQVVIIHTADEMHVKAANALLKTLEEPSGQVLFILIGHRLGAIPVTITSRCQKLHFYITDSQQTCTWLQTQLETDQSVEILLKIADGGPLKAKQFADAHILELRNTLLKKLCAIRQSANPLEGIDALLKSGVMEVLMLLRTLFQDVRRCQLGVSVASWTHSDCAYDIKQLASGYTAFALQTLLDRLGETEAYLQNGVSVNPQLALETLFLECDVCA